MCTVIYKKAEWTWSIYKDVHSDTWTEALKCFPSFLFVLYLIYWCMECCSFCMGIYFIDNGLCMMLHEFRDLFFLSFRCSDETTVWHSFWILTSFHPLIISSHNPIHLIIINPSIISKHVDKHSVGFICFNLWVFNQWMHSIYIIPYFWIYHILLFLFFETLPKITTTQLECLFFIKDLLLTNEANRLQ